MEGEASFFSSSSSAQRLANFRILPTISQHQFACVSSSRRQGLESQVNRFRRQTTPSVSARLVLVAPKQPPYAFRGSTAFPLSRLRRIVD